MTLEKFAYKPAPKKSIYIAGPMTGLPDLNFPAFHARAAELRALGHDVINPAEINPDQGMSWRDCMRTDIAALVFCEAIDMLPGWENSIGATLEHHIAQRLNMVISFAPGVAPGRPDGTPVELVPDWAAA